MLVVGLMSGTSADGVDAALVEIGWAEGRLAVETRAFVCRAYPSSLRVAVLEACEPSIGRVDRICWLNALLGETFAAAALEVIAAAGLRPSDVDLVASHGQTIYHATQPGDDPPSTLQIAAPAVIAERTGITTVADFRPRDVAAGGQGAPLVSYVDHLLFSHPSRNRIVQNVGGIANLTVLPAGAGADAIVAFDTGPGNMVIDALALTLVGEECDRDGRHAAEGRVDEELLGELLAHPYFRRSPPKTTGREQFGRAYADDLLRVARLRELSAADLLATATALTVRSIGDAVRSHVGPVDDVIVGGGGARNPTLMAWLAEELRPAQLWRHEDFGVDGDAKEAIAFAVLGYQTVHGRPNTLPRCTGARHPVVLGSIVPGANYLDLVRRVADASRTVDAR